MTINANGSYSFGTVTTFQSTSGNRKFALAYNGTDCVIIPVHAKQHLKVNGASIASGGTNVNCGNNQNVEWSSSTNHCVSWHDQQPNGCFVGFTVHQAFPAIGTQDIGPTAVWKPKHEYRS